MSQTKRFDVVIIGGGPGGYVCAIRCAQLGLTTALVERRERLGGTCLNIGCIPSKALLDSSEFYEKVRRAEEFGVRTGEVRPDLGKMMERKNAVVNRLTDGIRMLMKQNRVEVLTGTGSLLDASHVEVRGADGGRTVLETKNVVLATGSESAGLPFLPFDGSTVVSSTEALEFTEVPRRLLVIGAGAIGLELGSVWSRLGSEVHVVELMDQILPGWDPELARALSRELEKQGMKISTGMKVRGAEVKDGAAVVTAQDQDGTEVRLEADEVLVAVGRKPHYEGLNLEAVAVEREPDGKRIKVDERFMTATPGVYAIGDLIRGPMLAHKAEDEGIAVAEIIAGIPGHVNYAAIPGVVYTWPEAASVGKTETELSAEGRAYRKGVFPFAANARAAAMGDTTGFVKVLSDERYDTLLGVQIVGPWASDLIAEAVAVMEFHGSAEDIARTVHAHPTLSEAVREAALGADGRMINARNASGPVRAGKRAPVRN